MPLSNAASNVIKQLLGEMIPGTETFRRGQPLSVVSEVRRELVAHELLNTTFRSLITQYDPKIWPQKTLETDPPLRHVLAQELPGAPPLPRCPSRETMNASCGASFGNQPLPPTLLLFHFPWLDVHTGHARVWTLLHVLRYRCFFELLNMRMVVMVQPGELPRCHSRFASPLHASAHRGATADLQARCMQVLTAAHSCSPRRPHIPPGARRSASRPASLTATRASGPASAAAMRRSTIASPSKGTSPSSARGASTSCTPVCL